MKLNKNQLYHRVIDMDNLITTWRMRDLSSWTSSESKLQTEKPFSLANAQQAVAISDLHTQSVFMSLMQIPMQKRGCVAKITPRHFPCCPCWSVQSMLERSCPAPLGDFDENPFLAHGPKWCQK